MIKVGFFATYRIFTGVKEVEVEEPQTIVELMQNLSEMYGEDFRKQSLDGDRISRLSNVLVNGKHIAHLQQDETPLKDGDYVAIFPLIGGG